MRGLLHRFYRTSRITMGKLQFDDLELFTVEQPWRMNKPFESCVPPGFYHLVPHSSERWGDTWALVGETVSHFQEEGVPRYACIFHVGNYAKDVQGCIAVGLRPDSAYHMVFESRVAFDRLIEKLGTRGDHYLTIK